MGYGIPVRNSGSSSACWDRKYSPLGTWPAPWAEDLWLRPASVVDELSSYFVHSVEAVLLNAGEGEDIYRVGPSSDIYPETRKT